MKETEQSQPAAEGDAPGEEQPKGERKARKRARRAESSGLADKVRDVESRLAEVEARLERLDRGGA